MPSDSGRYICTASDGITVITDTVELRVTGKKGITGRTFVHLILRYNFSISIPNSKIYLTILSETPYNGRIPARIIKIDPEGSVDLPERSVGFEFECVVEGTPTPQVTWATGI